MRQLCTNHRYANFFRTSHIELICHTTASEQWFLTEIPHSTRLVPGFNEKFETILRAIMPPPLPVPAANSAVTTTATQILASARNYQNNASLFRLGKTATLSSATHNLPKVDNVLKERQRARSLARGSDGLISVIVSLWKVEGSSKAEQVCLVRRLSQLVLTYPFEIPNHRGRQAISPLIKC